MNKVAKPLLGDVNPLARPVVDGNVVQLRPIGVSVEDTEVLETIAYVATRQELEAKDMEFSQRSMDDIKRELGVELGEPHSESHAYVFPLIRWEMRVHEAKRLGLCLIDQGRYRVFFYYPVAA